jgi:hypothetical protein
LRQDFEKRTRTWDKTIVGRSAELGEWVEVCNKILGRGVPVFAFANSHFAGVSDTVGRPTAHEGEGHH